MWAWYTSLPDRDQAMVRQAMRIAGYGAIFGVFAALDGSAAIDDPPHGQLRLIYISPDGSEVPLNLTGQVSVPTLTNCTHSGPERYCPTPSRCPES